MSAMRANTLVQQQSTVRTMGVRDRLDTGTGYLEWVPRELIAGGATSLDADTTVLYQPVVSSEPPAQAVDENEPKRSLSELVSSHLGSLRKSYTAQGWQAFERGDYQVASRMFSLAENTALDDAEERAYIKIIMVYNGIAARQYAQASNSLSWLLEQDPLTGRFRHARAFNRIFDANGVKTIGALYEPPGSAGRSSGYQNPAYLSHNQAVETAATQDQTSAPMKALLAMVDWGRDRRGNAVSTARKIAPKDGRLSLLGAVLEEAERLRQAEDSDGTQPLAAPKLP